MRHFIGESVVFAVGADNGGPLNRSVCRRRHLALGNICLGRWSRLTAIGARRLPPTTGAGLGGIGGIGALIAEAARIASAFLSLVLVTLPTTICASIDHYHNN